MWGAHRVEFPPRRLPRLELWCYRLALLIGAPCFAWSRRDALQDWLQEGDGGLLFLLPVALAVLSILIQAPARRTAVRRLVLGINGSILMIPFLYAIVLSETVDHASCQARLRTLAAAALRYSDEHEGTLPPMEQPWTDALLPYVTHGRSYYRCPSDRPSRGRKTIVSYALNPHLRGRSLREVEAMGLAEQTVLVYEVDGLKRVCRHHGGMNLSFVDGHTRWLPERRLDEVIWDPWDSAVTAPVPPAPRPSGIPPDRPSGAPPR